MKTIVVPTDFSSAAEHAALYAAALAKSIQANVLLLHVYQLPIAVGDFPVMMVSGEELKHNADSGLTRVKETVEKQVPGVSVTFVSKMGDVLTELEAVCSGEEMVAVVTGTRDLGGFERFLTGSTTLSIVKNCPYPVIAVPDGSVIKTPERIALAVDFLHSNELPVQTINEYVALFNAELHLVHIEQEEEKQNPKQLPDAFENTTYHSFKEEDVAAGLSHFVSEKNIDLVIVLPHKHSLYERIFFKGHTQGIIESLPVPVLCIR